ncbi:tyrosine-protein phosphatase [Arthrobacter sp. Sa2CUA1]|uniref:Tyrosine-protein phosphatase n=1 Tax=Arthrobacter gallicola TaxID=2762225 RepID=A0ABR8UTS2_9MICC|nr:tyrosine-protein phosphatase [Arthrobacter gallicola]MBD7995913.1 tyrosine-protein phosphatase [Arthrobacter gallicola]
MKITTLEGTVNFRDVGGLPLAGGGSVASGVLYRSDALSSLTPRGLETLAGSGVDVLADFRTPAERQMAPNRLPAGRPLRILELPLFEGAFTGAAQAEMQRANLAGDPASAARAIQAAIAQLPTLGELYTGMLEDGAPVFAAAARTVAAGNGSAAVLHCTAGKDRTGVAAALLLEAAGVERNAVVADYQLSERNLAGEWSDRMLGMIAGMGVPLTEAVITLVTRSPADAIVTALDWVTANHGGAAGYLRAAGLSATELKQLQQRLRGQDPDPH